MHVTLVGGKRKCNLRLPNHSKRYASAPLIHASMDALAGCGESVIHPSPDGRILSPEAISQHSRASCCLTLQTQVSLTSQTVHGTSEELGGTAAGCNDLANSCTCGTGREGGELAGQGFAQGGWSRSVGLPRRGCPVANVASSL